MPTLTPAEIARAVLAWQADPRKHLLTCGTDSSHRKLVPLEKAGSVVLICPHVWTARPAC